MSTAQQLTRAFRTVTDTRLLEEMLESYTKGNSVLIRHVLMDRGDAITRDVKSHGYTKRDLAQWLFRQDGVTLVSLARRLGKKSALEALVEAGAPEFDYTCHVKGCDFGTDDEWTRMEHLRECHTEAEAAISL